MNMNKEQEEPPADLKPLFRREGQYANDISHHYIHRLTFPILD